ncbi:MAG: hypothetical protein K2Y20_04320 [Sphingomonas sp.]|nr:hypothetical protein [Sphingomonas sp.]
MASGAIRVEGGVRLIGLAPTGSLVLNAPQSVSVISGQGSIDLRDAAGALGGQLRITAGRIYAATDAAIANVNAANSIDARTLRLGNNDGVVIDDGLLRAGVIQLSGPNGVYIQNTGASTAFDLRRGFTANRIDISANAETAIVINGRLTNPAVPGGFFTGISTISRLGINESAGGLLGGFDRLSTANGCFILNIAGCSGGSDLMPNGDRLTGSLDPLAGYRSASAPLGLLTFQTFIRNGYPPLIDEPITGVGNEDLWTVGSPTDDSAKDDSPKDDRDPK